MKLKGFEKNSNYNEFEKKFKDKISNDIYNDVNKLNVNIAYFLYYFYHTDLYCQN